jgi:hypothetical protein
MAPNPRLKMPVAENETTRPMATSEYTAPATPPPTTRFRSFSIGPRQPTGMFS